MSNLGRVLTLFRPQAGPIALATLVLLASTLAGVLRPWPLALIVDAVLGGAELPGWIARWVPGRDRGLLLAWMIAATLALHATQSVLSAAHSYLLIRVGLAGLTRIRLRLFERLQCLGLGSKPSWSTGDLVYRASWDTYAFQTLFQQGVFGLLAAVLALWLMGGVMWRLNGPLFGASLALLPFVVLAMRLFGRRMNRRSLVAHRADSEVTSRVQEVVVTLPVIQSYTREPHEAARFGELVRAAQGARLAQHGSEVVYLAAIGILFGLATAGVTWLGAAQVRAGQLTVGQLLVFLAYLAQFHEPLRQLSHLGATVSDANAGAQRVFEILDLPDAIQERADARPVVAAAAEAGARGAGSDPSCPDPGRLGGPAPLRVRGGLGFDAVSFAYEAGRPALHDIRLRIAPGERVGIIGPSGAGKTTLLQLVPRFQDPTAGVVVLDGEDLRTLRVRELRAQIAWVPQEPVLLPGTVAENIAYGLPGASADAVEAAAARANAHEFIRRLPRGYATLVGEGNCRLSAGEKQRLNLARAFLKDAPVLLLDEPTSALDPENERLVTASLGDLIRCRTVLIVAHRPDTLRFVDRVVVLEGGRLTATGPLASLVLQNEFCAQFAGAATT